MRKKGDLEMDTKPETEPLAVGTFVKIRYTNFERAKIIEYRGPLGPGGMRIYRVRVSLKPKPFIADVREDQIVVIPPTQPHPRAFLYFYEIALQYYVSGRAAHRCGNTLITGNLFHHAVEMLLKGQLSKTIPLADLKRSKKFGHDLFRLWTHFKDLFPEHDLTEFDKMIVSVENFEKIRYPDAILSNGACIGYSSGRGKPVSITPRSTVPEYQIAVGDVDAFFGRLFPLCGLNPKASFSFLSAQGKQALTEDNIEASDWLA